MWHSPGGLGKLGRIAHEQSRSHKLTITGDINEPYRLGSIERRCTALSSLGVWLLGPPSRIATEAWKDRGHVSNPDNSSICDLAISTAADMVHGQALLVDKMSAVQCHGELYHERVSYQTKVRMKCKCLASSRALEQQPHGLRQQHAHNTSIHDSVQPYT